MAESQARNRPVRWAAMALWSAVIGAAAVCLCVLVSQSPGYLALQTNSDSLLGLAFAWDISHHPYAWRSFQLPRIPSLFPDLLLQTITYRAAPSDRWAIVAYMAAQFLGLAGAVGWLARRLNGAPVLLASSVSVALLGAVALADEALPGVSTTITSSFFIACVHMGPFIAALYAVGMASRLRQDWRWGETAGFTVLSALAILSDKLLLVSFVGPCVLALGGVAVLSGRGRRRAAGLTGLLAGGSVIAAIADARLYRQPDLAILWNKSRHRLQDFTHDNLAFALDHWPIVLACVAAPAVVMIAYPLSRRRLTALGAGDEADGPDAGGWAGIGQLQVPAQVLFLWLYAAAAMGATALAAGLLAWEGETSYRYLAPVFVLPFVFVTAALSSQRGLAVGAALAGGAGLGASLYATGAAAAPAPGPVTWSDQVGACLTRHGRELGLQAGLADYWVARPAMIGAGWKYQVNQVAANGTPYLWGTDRLWFSRSFQHADRAPAYNFIVATGLDLGAVAARYGEPSRRFDCGGGPVLWIYRDAPRMTRAVMEGMPDRPPTLAKLTPHPHVQRQDGAWRIEGRTDETEAFYGPYAAVTAGRYRLTLTFRPEDPADCVAFRQGFAASLAVTTAQRARNVVAKRALALAPSAGGACAVSGGQTVVVKRDAPDLETPIWVKSARPVVMTGYVFAAVRGS